MKTFARASIELVVAALALSAAISVQAQEPAAGAPGQSAGASPVPHPLLLKPSVGLNEQEKRGEFLFLQRCATCHMAKYADTMTRVLLPPAEFWRPLSGALKDATPERAAEAREFILRGGARMPGWQYTLEPSEVDDIVAYLKKH